MDPEKSFSFAQDQPLGLAKRTAASASQSEKAEIWIFFTPAPISSSLMLSQKENADVSMRVTLLGMVNFPCNFVQ